MYVLNWEYKCNLLIEFGKNRWNLARNGYKNDLNVQNEVLK